MEGEGTVEASKAQQPGQLEQQTERDPSVPEVAAESPGTPRGSSCVDRLAGARVNCLQAG